jgi:aryl-alcohol dehydrogenase-like predicted oxidoreductase
MNYRYLGRSALKVSPLCLGAMMFGGETDEPTSQRIIDKAFDAGVNFIDTADVYHAGRSEEVVGRAIAARRDHWVVATKFGFPFSQGPNEQGQSRKWIWQSVDASLKRLGTDYVDVLYFHRAVPNLPLEEAVRAVADLIRQGKVRYFGLSNFRGWRIAEVVRICDQLGIDRPVASEPLYNLVDRTAEVEQLPAARHYGLGSRLVQPARAGCADRQVCSRRTPAADSRAGRGDKRIQQTEWRPESLRIAQAVARHAEQRGTTSVAFRAGMGSQERGSQRDHRRTAYRGAVGELPASAAIGTRRRGRKVCRRPRTAGARLHTGIHGSRLPRRGPPSHLTRPA